MRKILIAIILIGVGCYKEESNMKLFASQNKRQRLIIFTGESNSGGIAPNSDATAGELAARPSVQIWNNTSGGFQDLDIGTNNLLGHTGLSGLYDDTHTWELELANICATNGIRQYLVKTGQGGSVIANWNTGGTYYTTLVSRVNGARTEIGQLPVVFWYTHGINDRIAGTASGTFKTSVQTHISNLKSSFPGAKFIMMKNMTNNGNDTYNTVIQEIADADDDVETIEVTSAGVQGDGNHYTYSGTKLIANRFWDKMIEKGW